MAQARGFVSPLCTLSKLWCEAVRAAIASSAGSYSPLCTLVSSAERRALTLLKRCRCADISGRRIANVGNQRGLQTALCLQIGRVPVVDQKETHC